MANDDKVPHPATGDALWRDPSIPFEQRADALIARMSLEEKISQMQNSSPAIDRLGIPAYDWWNECLHGVAWAGIATVFPQAIALAATWNTNLVHSVAVAISDEARAKHHDAIRRDDRSRFKGLTFWSPNINIFRDPRWGRGQETYGEDPYLTSEIGIAFVKGLQGQHPKYLKVAACAKHYAVHSGPEPTRHEFNAVVDERDLHETYLPAFEALVKQAKVEAVMGAYNRTNGQPCCAHERLLGEILYGQWNFQGHVVSDCGAIEDIYKHHRYVNTPEEAAAIAVKAGCDLNCGQTYKHLRQAIAQGLIDEESINRSLKRLIMTRLRLGMFDPPQEVPFTKIPIDVVDCAAHRELARQAVRESIVLLKNQGNLLPLSRSLKRIAVIGPTANDVEVLLGNYNGTPSKAITPYEGIRQAVAGKGEVMFAAGCEITGNSDKGFAQALAIAEKADVIIAVMGLSARLEGEEGAAKDSDAGGDRRDITLPGRQEELLKILHATGKPIVLVLTGGSALAIPWAKQNIPAIIMSWYGGEEAGTALAEVIFGDYCPAGRLPVTFYRSIDQLPPFEDYRMRGRTYRYFTGEPLWPFGFGLSYTKFQYSNLKLSAETIKPGENLTVSATVKNVGNRTGDEVVQLYISDIEATYSHPIRSLAGFKRIRLAAGESQTISFTITPKQMCIFDDAGDGIIEPGEFRISIGGGQPIAQTGKGGFVSGKLIVSGKPTIIKT